MSSFFPLSPPAHSFFLGPTVINIYILAAHDALAPIHSIQGPTPNVRQHTLRATAAAASATESEGHGPGLCSPRRDERSRGPGGRRQGPRASLEAHVVARDPSTHDRRRRLGPGDLADFLHLHVRFGGPRALLPSTPPQSPCCQMRLQKVFARRSRRPHQHLHSSLRCHQGTRLDGRPPRPAIPHSRSQGSDAAWCLDQRRESAEARGRRDPQLPARRRWEP